MTGERALLTGLQSSRFSHGEPGEVQIDGVLNGTGSREDSQAGQPRSLPSGWWLLPHLQGSPSSSDGVPSGAHYILPLGRSSGARPPLSSGPTQLGLVSQQCPVPAVGLWELGSELGRSPRGCCVSWASVSSELRGFPLHGRRAAREPVRTACPLTACKVCLCGGYSLGIVQL